MGAAYSQRLRDRVLAACDHGIPTKQVADVFAVSPAWVRRVKQRRRESGELTPRPLGGRRRWKIDRERLAELVREHTDATFEELRAILGVECAESAIRTALKKLGFTYKERRLRGRAGSSRRRRATRATASGTADARYTETENALGIGLRFRPQIRHPQRRPGRPEPVRRPVHLQDRPPRRKPGTLLLIHAETE